MPFITVSSGSYLGLKFLDELRLALLSFLVGLQLAFVAGVFLFEPSSQFDVLLQQPLRARVLTPRRLAPLQLQRLLQLQAQKTSGKP